MKKTNNKYVWCIFTAPNFAKIQNPEADGPDELPYALLFTNGIPASPKSVMVGKVFTDPLLAREMYQSLMEDFQNTFYPKTDSDKPKL